LIPAVNDDTIHHDHDHTSSCHALAVNRHKQAKQEEDVEIEPLPPLPCHHDVSWPSLPNADDGTADDGPCRASEGNQGDQRVVVVVGVVGGGAREERE